MRPLGQVIIGYIRMCSDDQSILTCEVLVCELGRTFGPFESSRVHSPCTGKFIHCSVL
jgi:hypothetical protein